MLPTQTHPYTVYEMKARTLRRSDIDTAVRKITQSTTPVAQYVFVTTKPVSEEMHDYLRQVSERCPQTEFQIFDCVQLLNHFLHLFHERRHEFWERFVKLVIQDRAVSQRLKEQLIEFAHTESSDATRKATDTYDERGTGR